MNKRVGYSLLCLGLGLAQDPQFSQFFANQVILSPAFTGIGEGPRIALAYRMQWTAIPGYYRTFAAVYDQPIFFGRVRNGLGLSFMADQAGEGNLTKLNVLLNYAIHIELTRTSAFSMGIAGGIVQSSIDFFRLRFPDQIDPNAGFILPTQERNFFQNRIHEDVAAGALYYNKYLYVGTSVMHITQPTQRFYRSSLANPADARLPIRANFFAGAQIPLDPLREGRQALGPAVMYRIQRPFQQLDVGLYFTSLPIVIGVWYRHQDAIIGLVGLQKGIFRVGYSYDYTISSLTNRLSAGSHEVSVVVEFSQERQSLGTRRRRNYPCPRF
ncbi:MAG: type IX secretion system membrane protein PorP/SprF [Bacteroidia bacterium]|nr:type IX secretion system membrane protein PorP/SprF [Bacteroidia bacterium]MDW8088789.1 type IX secretion system membrane protein PorP/SprF [Bacteroidia bacterium]